MILSNEGIKAALQDGTIGIDPAPLENHIETSAVDLTLSNIGSSPKSVITAEAL
jgi:deoxycytidine triphosphate deaminase